MQISLLLPNYFMHASQIFIYGQILCLLRLGRTSSERGGFTGKKKKPVAFSSIKLSKQIYCDNKTTELVKSMPDMSV